MSKVLNFEFIKSWEDALFSVFSPPMLIYFFHLFPMILTVNSHTATTTIYIVLFKLRLIT